MQGNNKYKTVIYSMFIFLLMFSLFMYYREPGFFQHDMVEYALYAEYIVLDDYDELYTPYIIPASDLGLPWRTGTLWLGTAMFFLFHIFGAKSAELAVMFTQFLFGSLAIVVLYLFLEKLYGMHLPAVLSALVFGLSAPLFNAVLSKDHGLEFFFAFCAMYLLLRGIKEKSTLFLFFSSCSLGLLLWMREGALFFPIIYYGFFLLHVVSYDKNRMPAIQWDKTLITKKNIAALTIPYVILTLIAFKLYVWLLLTVALEKSNAGFFTYAQDIFTGIVAWYPLLYFFFLALGLFFTIRAKEKTALFFFCVSILFLMVFTKNGTFDLRHLGIYIFFSWSVIMCYGMVQWQEHLGGWKKYLAVTLALFLCIQVFVPGISLFEERKEHIYTKEFAQQIAVVVPQEGIVFIYQDFCVFVVYYGKRTCQGLPDNFIETVDPLLLSGKRVFVPFEAGFGFYNDAIKGAIEERYTLTIVYEGKFENYHHADLNSQVYDEKLIEVRMK